MGDIAAEPVQADAVVASIPLATTIEAVGLLFSAFDLARLARPTERSESRADGEEGGCTSSHDGSVFWAQLQVSLAGACWCSV